MNMDSLKLENVEKIIKRLKSQRRKSKIDLSKIPICGICKFILNDPYQTICGCLYCKECIESWLVSHNNCPGDSDECREVVIFVKNGIREDRAKFKEVSNSKVRCLFEECREMIEINRMSEHLDLCDYKTVPCNLCKESVVQIRFEDHVQKECPGRKVLCKHCNSEVTFGVLQQEHNNPRHDNVCKEYVGNCPFNCDDGQMVRIFDHKNICENRPVHCPLSMWGCLVANLMACRLEDHFRADVLAHSTLMVEHFDQRTTKLKELHSKLDESDKIIGELKLTISILEKGLVDQQKLVKHQLSYNVTAVANEEDVIWRNGEMLWKIENFTKLLENGKAGMNPIILSEPFFTSEFGYRMCLKMYPYGDGIGRGSYVSLFFAIMRGAYDDILQWPFSSKIRLTLQTGNRSVTGPTETFKPDPRSPCYVKPTNAFNVGSGSPRFVSHDSLYRNYMVNDSFFIMAEVLS